MAYNELFFQKELVHSAKVHQQLGEITTHRFKKGWPDVLIKELHCHTAHIECKYEIKRVTHSRIPVGTTELQKICLKNMQRFGMWTMVLVLVEFDRARRVCYPVYDISIEEIDLDKYPFQPYKILHRDNIKGKYYSVWPTKQIIQDLTINRKTLV